MRPYSEQHRVPSQRQLFQMAHRQLAEANDTFLEMVNHPTNPMTRADLARCIERRPQVWGRFAGWLDRLP